MLSQRSIVKIKVFYTWGEGILNGKYDPGFKKIITWDIPLLDGYEYQFVENTSKDPGSHHYHGIVNPTLVKDIENWEAGAILIFGWKFKSHLKCLRYFHNKIPVYFRGDSNLMDENNSVLKNIFKMIVLKNIYKYIDYCFYVGSENKKYFLKYGLNEKQLIYAPHAVDNNRFGRNQYYSLKTELGLNENDFVFLFAGKLESKKNPILLINAFININTPDTKLLIVGNGEQENAIKQMLSRLEKTIKDRIIFMGFHNQQKMPQLYKSVNVFVLPSQGPGETWGLAVNEALASGVPAIVSNKCGCSSDLIINYKNGIIFESNKIIELENAMKFMIDNKETTKEMGEYGKAFIQNWSYENICVQIEKKLKEENGF
jgi:glycosyltransferase involved in cell wall biosynthesis